MDKVNFIFAEDPAELLINIRSHLKKENLDPVSLSIAKDHNNFCAKVIGKPKDEFIG